MSDEMNEINRLINLDPLDLIKDDAAIAKIVAYQRRMRALYDSGEKPEKQQLSNIKGSALLDKLKLSPNVKLGDRRS